MEKIRLTSSVYLADPCYEASSNCAVKLADVVVPGIYHVEIINEGQYVASLRLTHENYNPYFPITEEIGTVYVDSGQAGVFNADYYERNQPDNDFQNTGSWYRRVSELTLNYPYYGTIDGEGAIASSGYGDGAYRCFCARNRSGYIVALRIEFV